MSYTNDYLFEADYDIDELEWVVPQRAIAVVEPAVVERAPHANLA